VTAWIRGLSDRGELILINVICFGWPIVGALMWFAIRPRVVVMTTWRAAELIALELFSAVAAGAVLRIRGWRLRRLGLTPSFSQTIAGVAYYYFYVMAWLLLGRALYAIPPIAAAFDSTPRVTHTAPWPLLLAIVIINPLYEAAFVLAYNIEALSHRGAAFAITTSTAIRVAYNLYQGPSAIFSIGLFGLLAAAVYWRWRSAWPVIVMHAIADAIAVAR
jgi:hypothetical protein